MAEAVVANDVERRELVPEQGLVEVDEAGDDAQDDRGGGGREQEPAISESAQNARGTYSLGKPDGPKNQLSTA